MTIAGPEEVHGASPLAGCFYRPAGAGLHPVVIMLLGSGPADRDSLGYVPPLRRNFLASGLVALAWDKPGIGPHVQDE